MKAYQRIANCVMARDNCAKSGNEEWYERHQEVADAIVRERFPSGGGFDSGTFINWDKTKPERLVFSTSYHHMDEYGMYDGWTSHEVVVTPSLALDFDLRVTGRDRNDIKDYIAEAFHVALSTEVD